MGKFNSTKTGHDKREATSVAHVKPEHCTMIMLAPCTDHKSFIPQDERIQLPVLVQASKSLADLTATINCG